MFFLERKESYAMPNILGNCSQPVYISLESDSEK